MAIMASGRESKTSRTAAIVPDAARGRKGQAAGMTPRHV